MTTNRAKEQALFKEQVRATMTDKLTPEEQALLDGGEATADTDTDTEAEPRTEPESDLLPEPGDVTPAWVVMPHDLTLPSGRLVGFMRFRAPLTDAPGKGERHCILWNLTSADEKLALKRTRGESMRTMPELAKQMIRAIDGARADWTGKSGPGNVDRFWDEIGSRYRQQIVNYYVKSHTLTTEEQADFFENCIAIRTVG